MLISKNKFFKGLALVLAVMMILPAVLACTDEAAQQSISEIKDAMLSEQDVKDIVAAAIAANPGVTADDIKDIVKEATEGLASSADVDKAVKDAVDSAVKDLPSKDDVDAAIKDAVGKIEADNKTEAEGDAALAAKIIEVKAKIEVLKEAYANKKADFSTATYAEIVTLISNATATVGAVKTVEEAEALYTKLESDLAAFASYALALYTKWLALNGNVVAGKTDADEDSLAAITEYQNLVKEAVAHYYQLNRNTDYAELRKYVHAYDNNGDAITIDLVAFAGYDKDDAISAGTILQFNRELNETLLTVGTKTYANLANQYYVAFKTAAENAAKDVDNLIKAIKTVSLADDSQAKITAARDAYTALYNRFVVKGKLVTELPLDDTTKGLKVVEEYTTLTTAEDRTIALRSAGAALMYITVNGKPLTVAYQEFCDKGLDQETIKRVFSDEEAANAKALFDAIKDWAYNADETLNIWKQPANNSTKSSDFADLNYFFPDFQKQYWNYHMLTYIPDDLAKLFKGDFTVADAINTTKDDANVYKTQGTNSAYQIIKQAVREIVEINREVVDDVTKIDATLRAKISELGNNIVNAQKFGQYKAKSDGKFELDDDVSMGNSNTGSMIKAAIAQLVKETSELEGDEKITLNDFELQYVNAKTTINGIEYKGFETKKDNISRYLVGFNATITEYMYAHYGPAESQIKAFKNSVKNLNTDTAVSSKAATLLWADIVGWIVETEEASGFNFRSELEEAITTLKAKIQTINERIGTTKSSANSLWKEYDDLVSKIGKINKKNTAKTYKNAENQDSTMLGQIDTLDEAQITAAWDALTTFISHGGSNMLEAQSTTKDVLYHDEVQLYKYTSFVDNSKFDALYDAKLKLDQCIAAANKFIEAYSLINGETSKLYAGVDLTNFGAYDIDKKDDKYFLGQFETVTVNGKDTSVWVREMTIVEALEAIRSAYGAFKTINNGRQYAPVEAYRSEDEAKSATYKAIVLAYVKAMAIDAIEGAAANNANPGQILASIEVIRKADTDTQAEIDIAISHFNTVSGLNIVAPVKLADFGL